MEEHIKVEKTFRYFSYGNPKKAKYLWVILHGYGQLPAFFIRKFHSLNPDEHFVIAPEGMHRFYLEGTSGRVGASWMTKESRLTDIEDNNRFLNALSKHILSNYNFDKKILLGFSQGGATACRWHEMGNFKASIFILWASVFPPDLELPKKNNAFINSKNIFVIGDDDPYYNKEKIQEVKADLTNSNINFSSLEYKGGHNINTEALEKLITRI